MYCELGGDVCGEIGRLGHEKDTRQKERGRWISNDTATRCVVVCCSVMQCVAVCCSVLQCVALFFSEIFLIKKVLHINRKEAY